MFDLERMVDEKLDSLEARLFQNDELMSRLHGTEDPAEALAILRGAIREERNKIVSEVAQKCAAEIAHTEAEAVYRQALAGEAFTIH